MKVVYIRTSTEEQNPENQLADIEKIAGKDYILYKEQQSAWNQEKERPEFNKIIKEIKSSRLSDLYVWDLDRIYRNRINLVDFFKLSKSFKVNIHSYRQVWLEDINKIPTPWNEIVSDMFIQILGWLAEEESTKKSERVRSARRFKEDGVYSYTGKKWGRKTLSTQKQNLLIEMNNRIPKPSMRYMAKELNISLGVVHKYLTFLVKEKTLDSNSSQLNSNEQKN